MTAFSLLDRDTADFLKPCRLRLVRGSSGPLPDLSDGADRRADIFDDARAGPGAPKLLALMAILDEFDKRVSRTMRSSYRLRRPCQPTRPLCHKSRLVVQRLLGWLSDPLALR